MTLKSFTITLTSVLGCASIVQLQNGGLFKLLAHNILNINIRVVNKVGSKCVKSLSSKIQLFIVILTCIINETYIINEYSYIYIAISIGFI